jgi:N-acetylglutamate synthase-like GNAT family acetyltransferase
MKFQIQFIRAKTKRFLNGFPVRNLISKGEQNMNKGKTSKKSRISKDIKIINVDKNNLAQYSKGPACFLNPQHKGVQKKFEWLKKQLKEGLKIKVLYSEKDKKIVGFIEYIPGEYAWRAVDAKGYVFIHCIWVSPNKFKRKGNGSLLVKDCIEDAKSQGKYGVAVVTSEGSFMAGKDIFLKNGFKSVAQVNPSFELMVKILKKGSLPKFRNWESKLNKYNGLNIIYSNQCPWVARSIKELSEIAKKKGLKVKVTELNNAKKAQNAPSLYGVFNLVYNGRLLVDHYISSKRLQNIINKEKIK